MSVVFPCCPEDRLYCGLQFSIFLQDDLTLLFFWLELTANKTVELGNKSAMGFVDLLLLSLPVGVVPGFATKLRNFLLSFVSWVELFRRFKLFDAPPFALPLAVALAAAASSMSLCATSLGKRDRTTADAARASAASLRCPLKIYKSYRKKTIAVNTKTANTIRAYNKASDLSYDALKVSLGYTVRLKWQ